MKKRLMWRVRLAGLAIAGVLCALAATGDAHATSATQSVGFPMYEYPTIGTLWNDINAAGSQVPILIVNPGSGPGASVDPTYTSHIATNTAAGQRSIGYVYTSYQSRSITDVIRDIDTFYQFYPGISGIFVDLVQNGSASDLCYAATVHNYIKAKHPTSLVVMNFGTNVEARYEPYADIFMNAENFYSVYTSWAARTDGFENNAANANRFWHIVHTTSSGQLANALSLARTNNAGWVTVTDATMPNPYNVTPSYWTTFLSSVASLPQSSIPNRGLTALPAGCLDLSLTVSSNAGVIQAGVKNTDTTRASWGPTKVSFGLPSGVSLKSLSAGAGWGCGDATCTYSGTLAANTAAPDINAVLDVGCSYTSGNVVVTLQNFANNVATQAVAVTKPACPSAAATTPSQPTENKPVWTTITTTSTADDSIPNPFTQTEADINSQRAAASDTTPANTGVAEAFNFTPIGWGLAGVVLVGMSVGVYAIWRKHHHAAI